MIWGASISIGVGEKPPRFHGSSCQIIISNDHIVDPLSGWMSPWWWPCILIRFGSWFPKDEFGSPPTVTSKLEQKKQTRWGFVGCLSIVHQCRSHGAQIYVNQGSLDYQFWKDCNSEKFPLYLDLFNGDFHFFYHGKSPLNHQFGRICFGFFLASNKQIQVTVGRHFLLRWCHSLTPCNFWEDRSGVSKIRLGGAVLKSHVKQAECLQLQFFRVRTSLY